MRVQRLGRYELMRHLATGGMARVYLARAAGPGGFSRHVVLKAIPAERVDDDAFISMFLDEARLVATLHHQNIAQVFEVGRADDGTYFLAMEYVHGETVRHLLSTAAKRGVRLPFEVGLSITSAAAAGLHHAHERRDERGRPLGIVHRDVSPSNLILGFDGSIKLIDFGIAKANLRTTHTADGFIKGKAGYMAPEQARGYEVDRRSDVFALGVLAYELTTQTRAFQAESQFETMQRAMRADIEPPSKRVPGYPAALEDVIMTALELDPDDRFQDAEAMRVAIEDTARELNLVLGSGPVMRALDVLFTQRPEPWLAAAPGPDEEQAALVTSSGPLIMVIPRTPTKVRLARGTVNDELSDHEQPVIQQDDDLGQRHSSPVTVDLTTQPYERALPIAQSTLEPTAPIKRISTSRAAVERSADPVQLRAPTSPSGRITGLPLPAPEVPLTPVPIPAPIAFDPSTAAISALPRKVGELPQAAIVTPRAASVMPTLRPSRTRTIAIGVAAFAVLVTLISVLAVSTRSDQPVAHPDDAVVVAAPPSAPPPAPAPAAPAPAKAPARAAATAGTVQLRVTTDPDGATVVLDGVRLGVTPFDGPVTVRPGQAWLKVRKRGYAAVKTRVSFEHAIEWYVALRPLRR